MRALLRFLTIAAPVSGVLLAGTPPVLAWEPIHSSTPVWCEAAPYALGAISPDLGDAQSEASIREGFDAWTTLGCGLTTSWEGRTTSIAGRGDGVSMAGWVESGWDYDPNAIGVTGPRWGGRCIAEADMELNGVDYRWTTGAGRGESVNAYSIITHEAGHYYGLGHSSDPNAMMYFAYGGGISELNADDQAGICALYPGTGTPTDCTTTGCPTGQSCVAGRCERPAGDGSMCSTCERSSQCSGDSSFCLLYPNGSGYCGTNCTSSSDCAEDGACVDVGDGVGQCVRYVGDQPSCEGGGTTDPTGCRNDSDCETTERCDTLTGECVARPVDRSGLGESCETRDECDSALCFRTPAGGVCSQSCDWLTPTSCPSGFYCNASATGSCGGGVCLAGTAGAKALGESCAADTECSTLYCGAGICSRPCVPGSVGSCPDAYTCEAGPLGDSCGSCVPAAGLGETCFASDDCVSKLCAVTSEVSFCTDSCEGDAGCPLGYHCAGAGAQNVCAPNGDGGGDDDDDGSCGCRAAGGDAGHPAAGFALLALGLAAVVRRRKRR